MAGGWARPRGLAQPVVGWKAMELPGGPIGTCGPAQKRPFHLDHYRSFELSSHGKVGSCGDEECVRSFAFGRWGDDPARRRWSAAAACFWKTDAEGITAALAPRARRSQSSAAYVPLWTSFYASFIYAETAGPYLKTVTVPESKNVRSRLRLSSGAQRPVDKEKWLREAYDGKASW